MNVILSRVLEKRSKGVGIECRHLNDILDLLRCSKFALIKADEMNYPAASWREFPS